MTVVTAIGRVLVRAWSGPWCQLPDGWARAVGRPGGRQSPGRWSMIWSSAWRSSAGSTMTVTTAPTRYLPPPQLGVGDTGVQDTRGLGAAEPACARRPGQMLDAVPFGFRFLGHCEAAWTDEAVRFRCVRSSARDRTSTPAGCRRGGEGDRGSRAMRLSVFSHPKSRVCLGVSLFRP